MMFLCMSHVQERVYVCVQERVYVYVQERVYVYVQERVYVYVYSPIIALCNNLYLLKYRPDHC